MEKTREVEKVGLGVGLSLCPDRDRRGGVQPPNGLPCLTPEKVLGKVLPTVFYSAHFLPMSRVFVFWGFFL